MKRGKKWLLALAAGFAGGVVYGYLHKHTDSDGCFVCRGSAG